ncbi:MAG: thymidylate synthase, flavin-dependent [Spirochaetes bacterium GWF1_51_8]|nr:MAG: thymidylate synthase, flavin-dependent [Spirochaetes bacterium GWF1_51_8]
MNVELRSYNPDPEKNIEFNARICYDSHSKISEDSYKSFLPTLMKNGHLSIFEHSWASFYIDGISRAASHQLVRHRIASFTQRSQRYVTESHFEYIVPDSVAASPQALALYEGAMKSLQEGYRLLLEMGIRKEDARFLLPNATPTSLTITANFREWLHIIDLRVSPHAQWEIREMCAVVWKRLYQIAPIVFGPTYFQHWSKDFDYKLKIFQEEIAILDPRD